MDHTFVSGQEKEEPPSIVGCGSRREFTYRQVYKRVWVGGRNVAMMVAETTWKPLVGAIGGLAVVSVGRHGRMVR